MKRDNTKNRKHSDSNWKPLVIKIIFPSVIIPTPTSGGEKSTYFLMLMNNTVPLSGRSTTSKKAIRNNTTKVDL
jgi:hypothetical protein